jgi:Gas vesicle protein
VSPQTSVFNVGTRERGEVSLLEILDHVLNTGVVLHGSLVVSLAGVDLLYVGLNAVITSIETARRALPRAAGKQNR